MTLITNQHTLVSSILYSEEGEELNFSILRIDGTKQPSVIKAYLKTLILTDEDLDIGQIEDSKVTWPLYVDSSVSNHVYESIWPTKCIVSFQVHTWGKAAIVRLYKDMKGAV